MRACIAVAFALAACGTKPDLDTSTAEACSLDDTLERLDSWACAADRSCAVLDDCAIVTGPSCSFWVLSDTAVAAFYQLQDELSAEGCDFNGIDCQQPVPFYDCVDGTCSAAEETAYDCDD